MGKESYTPSAQALSSGSYSAIFGRALSVKGSSAMWMILAVLIVAVLSVIGVTAYALEISGETQRED